MTLVTELARLHVFWCHHAIDAKVKKRNANGDAVAPIFFVKIMHTRWLDYQNCAHKAA